jgi:hypothetical protein
MFVILCDCQLLQHKKRQINADISGQMSFMKQVGLVEKARRSRA